MQYVMLQCNYCGQDVLSNQQQGIDIATLTSVVFKGDLLVSVFSTNL